MINAFLNLLFPMQCVVCGQSAYDWRSGPLCESCEGAMKPLEQPFCSRCGFPTAIPDVVCIACLGGRTQVDLARSALAFDDVVRHVIHHFKYGNRVSLARPLGRVLRACLEREPFEAELVVPVPLHPTRERQRGYNQAALLAARVHRRVDLNLLRRRRNSESQTGLTWSQRQANVRGAFECCRRIREPVVVVDDVQTTGATIGEIARILRKGGAPRVEAITLARAGLSWAATGEDRGVTEEACSR